MPQGEGSSAPTKPGTAATANPSSRPTTPRSSVSQPPGANQRSSPRPTNTQMTTTTTAKTSRPSISSAVVPYVSASGTRQSIASPRSSRPSSTKGPSSPQQANRVQEKQPQHPGSASGSRRASGTAEESTRRRSSTSAVSEEMRRLSSLFESLHRMSLHSQHALSHQKQVLGLSSPRTPTSPRPTSCSTTQRPLREDHAAAATSVVGRVEKALYVGMAKRQPRRSSMPQVFSAKRNWGTRKRRTALFRRSHAPPAPRCSIAAPAPLIPPPQAAALPSASEGAIITSVPAPSSLRSSPLASPASIHSNTLSTVPVQIPTGRYLAPPPPRATYIIPVPTASVPWPTTPASTVASSDRVSSSVPSGGESTRYPRLVVFTSESANPQPLDIIEWHVSESDLVVTCTPVEQNMPAAQDASQHQGGGQRRAEATDASAPARGTALTSDVGTGPPSARIRNGEHSLARMEEECQTPVTWLTEQPFERTEERVKTPVEIASEPDGHTVIPEILQGIVESTFQKTTSNNKVQSQMNEKNRNKKLTEKLITKNKNNYTINSVVGNSYDSNTLKTIKAITAEILEKTTNQKKSKDNHQWRNIQSKSVQKKDDIPTSIKIYEQNQVITDSEAEVSRKSVFLTPIPQTDNTMSGPTFFGPAGAVWNLNHWNTADDTKLIHHKVNGSPLNDFPVCNQDVRQESREVVMKSKQTAKDKSNLPAEGLFPDATSRESRLIKDKMKAETSTKDNSDIIGDNGFIFNHTVRKEKNTSSEKNSTLPKVSSEFPRSDTNCDGKDEIPRVNTISAADTEPNTFRMDGNDSKQFSLKKASNSGESELSLREKFNISEEHENKTFRQLSPYLSQVDNYFKDLHYLDDEPSPMTGSGVFLHKSLDPQYSNPNSNPTNSEEVDAQSTNNTIASTWDQLFTYPSFTSSLAGPISLAISDQLPIPPQESKDVPPHSPVITKEHSSMATPCVILTPPTPKLSTNGLHNDLHPFLESCRPATAPIIHDASTSTQSLVQKKEEITDQLPRNYGNDRTNIVTTTVASPTVQRISLKDIHPDTKTNETRKQGATLWSAPSQELGTISPHIVESSTTDSECERLRIEEIEKTLRFRLPTTSLATTIAKSEDSSSLVVKNSSKRTVVFAQSSSKTETFQRRIDPDSFDFGFLSGSSHLHFAIVPNTFNISRPMETSNPSKNQSTISNEEDLEEDRVTTSPLSKTVQLKALSPGSSLIRYLPSEHTNNVSSKNSHSPIIGSNLIKSILRLNSPEDNKEAKSQNSFDNVVSPHTRDRQLNDEAVPCKSTKEQTLTCEEDFSSPIIKIALTKPPRIAHFSHTFSPTGVKRKLGLFSENNQAIHQMIQDSFHEDPSDTSDLSSSLSIGEHLSKEQSLDELSRDEALPSIHEESDPHPLSMKGVSSPSEINAGMIITSTTRTAVNSDDFKQGSMDSDTSNGENSLPERNHSIASPKCRLTKKRTSRRRSTSNSPQQKLKATESSPEKSPRAKRNLIHRFSDMFTKPFKSKSSSSRSPSRDSPRKNVGRLLTRQSRPPQSYD